MASRLTKRLLRLFTWVLGGLLAIIAAIALYEITLFAFSSEANALDAAKVAFIRECTRTGLNPTEFGDPQRIERQDRAYEFVWKNPSSGDEIRALVSHLPGGAEAWLMCLVRGHGRHLLGDMTDTFTARQVDGGDLVGGEENSVFVIV
jgi:hypothetical protein